MPPSINPAFFPKRPAGIRIRFVSGVLLGFGYGQRGGGFDILKRGGSNVVFFAPVPVKVNGFALYCTGAPEFGRPRIGCAGWPKGLIVGKTWVTVTYWKSKTPEGFPVFASDEIKY